MELTGWEPFRENVMQLLDTQVLTSSCGWSEEFIDNTVLKVGDFNVLAGDRALAGMFGLPE